MDILLDVSYGNKMLDRADVESLAEFAIGRLDLPQSCELSISFIDNEEIAALNEEYRGKVGPTDVLSFECDNLDDGFPEGDTYSLGDIVIACDVAQKQSVEIGWSFMEEIELLVIHGILHLCGYDHVEDADAAIMETKQKELLSLWNNEKKLA